MKKWDVSIVMIALTLSMGFLIINFWIFPQSAQPENIVNIYMDGILYETQSLEEDGVIVINQGNGITNRVEIKGGTVRMSQATCSSQDCVRMAPLCGEDAGLALGRVIVCLPHRVSVELELDQ